jgi:putative ATPase
MDLFESVLKQSGDAPLAERMRPQTLAEVVGQRHLLAPGKLLQQLITTDQVSSLIFWGPPGTGKTTLAQVIANTTRANFVFFSAVLNGVKEVREIVKQAQQERAFQGRKTVLFVDEIHRFNKAQQDAFLPYVEKGDLILIGATTENPSFTINAALLSRSRVLPLEPLTAEEIEVLLRRALTDRRGLNGRCELSREALEFLSLQADGDARLALSTLETAASTARGELTLELLQEALQNKPLRYDRAGDEHYNVISAFIKSLRGSDPDAALYWLARMLEAGEDPLFIARRMVIFASEDVGNADPRALQIALAVQQAIHFVGLPEGRINLAQGVTYLATAPKSNASYLGIDAALREVRASGTLPVPLHIRNAPTRLMQELDYGKGYQYAHNTAGVVTHSHLPEELVGKHFYHPADSGYEKTIAERQAFLRQQQKLAADRTSASEADEKTP